jgi:hypothetical protein
LVEFAGGTEVALSPEERKEKIRREARKLAREQGLDWKELPRERRQEFRQQVRQSLGVPRKAKTAE